MQVASGAEGIERRREPRFAVPIRAKILGETVMVRNWSLIGLRVVDFPAELPNLDDEIRIRLILNHKALSVSIACWSDVVRVNPEQRTFALHYTSVEPGDYELLETYTRILSKN